MLKNTTILVQVHKEIGNTIKQALSFSKNVIVYDDNSGLNFSEYGKKITIIKSNIYSGEYEVALNAIIDKVSTKYLCRVNGGDELLHIEEPNELFDMWLARYNIEIPSHELDVSYYFRGGTSILSGSVIPTDIYKRLLINYTDAMKKSIKRFGVFAGRELLGGKYECMLSGEVSCIFTYKMWGGKYEAFKIGSDDRRKV